MISCNNGHLFNPQIQLLFVIAIESLGFVSMFKLKNEEAIPAYFKNIIIKLLMDFLSTVYYGTLMDARG